MATTVSIEEIKDILASDQKLSQNIKDEILKSFQTRLETIESLKKNQQELIGDIELPENDMGEIDFPTLDSSVNSHIKKLKLYNDLKDTGMKLVGVIANKKKTDINHVLKDYNVEVDH